MTARRKWSSLLINMRLKCNDRATFCRKRRLQSVRKAEFWQIGQSDLNRPFSEILQRGDQGKMAQK